MEINWESDQSHIFLNPRYPEDDQRRFNTILDEAKGLSGHVWLSTSGSSAPKWVGLSKQALLNSAQAVNLHLQSNSDDCWINVLPFFHVGGIGIWARAYLSGARVIDFTRHFTVKWNGEQFYDCLVEEQGTLTALVPAQLHDLVLLEKKPPECLRGVIIGGGTLVPGLYERAIALNWPVLPSYGLTECGSQVATAALDSLESRREPLLQLLTHVNAREQEGRISLSGSSLLSVYAFWEGESIRFLDPKKEGWFCTEDRGFLQGRSLILQGRLDSIVKVGGENVDLARLENLLQTLRLENGLGCEVVLVAIPDDRLEHFLCCVYEGINEGGVKLLIERFHQVVLPFERIRKIVGIPCLPRSPIGKIMKKELNDRINKVIISHAQLRSIQELSSKRVLNENRPCS